MCWFAFVREGMNLFVRCVCDVVCDAVWFVSCCAVVFVCVVVLKVPGYGVCDLLCGDVCCFIDVFLCLRVWLMCACVLLPVYCVMLYGLPFGVLCDVVWLVLLCCCMFVYSCEFEDACVFCM